MIILTRLGGHALAVNPDLIERAEATPDTVVTMTDGHKFVVAESLDLLVERVRAWRAGVAAAAYRAVADAELLGTPLVQDDGHEDGEPHPYGTVHHRNDTGQQRVDRLGLAAALASHPLARVLPLSRKEG